MRERQLLECPCDWKVSGRRPNRSSSRNLSEGLILLKRSLVVLTSVAVVIAFLVSAAPAHARAARDDAPEVRQVSKVSVDWKWLKGGWNVRFTTRETGLIGVGTEACERYVSRLAHVAFRVLSGACGILALYAASLVVRERCLNAFVRLSYVNPVAVGSRTC